MAFKEAKNAALKEMKAKVHTFYFVVV